MDEKQLPIHILLADDDEDDRALFRETLNELSIPVILHTVEDGNKLMRALSSIKTLPPPHVIFLDINMPLKDGIECLQEIRSHSKFDSVPVFMFSTSDNNNEIHSAFEKGANLYIQKDVFFSAEKNIIEKLFTGSYSEYLKKLPREKFVLKKNK